MMWSGKCSDQQRRIKRLSNTFLVFLLFVATAGAGPAPDSSIPRSLAEIQAAGELRHLGVPYANFVTGAGDGLDVEVIRLFADHLNLEYVYVRADWENVIPSLIGHEVNRQGGEVTLGEAVPVTGDLIANGLTRLNWREQVLDYSISTFPTQIWLLSRGDGPFEPISPSDSRETDIQLVQSQMNERTVLCKANTCLDPSLYDFSALGTQPVLFEGLLNELAPAMLDNRAEATILGVPDALVALRKWPNKIMVVGPVSQAQVMGVGFPKSSVALRDAFDSFFCELWNSGTYLKLIRKYYPTALDYYPDFFAGTLKDPNSSRIATRDDK